VKGKTAEPGKDGTQMKGHPLLTVATVAMVAAIALALHSWPLWILATICLLTAISTIWEPAT